MLTKVCPNKSTVLSNYDLIGFSKCRKIKMELNSLRYLDLILMEKKPMDEDGFYDIFAIDAITGARLSVEHENYI
ncbi:MAG TPA: hypothetical protein VKR53_20075 [Puia sp.]|nr:hypothetical protein [Puia sp.]